MTAGEWGARNRPWHRCSCWCEGGLKCEDGGRRRMSGSYPDAGDEETLTREKECPQRSWEVAEPEHTRSKGAGLHHLQAVEVRGSASSRGE